LIVATQGQEALLQTQWEVLRTVSEGMRLLRPEEACAMVPCCGRKRWSAAIHDPGAADIDVDALHQGYLRGFAATAAR